MSTSNENIQKREYCLPQIQRIILDNEISLALESNPPVVPGEEISKIPDYFNNDPFKTGSV
jgi:hypothetical protein